ncbi:hypothetical protein L1049_028488 [Liquidambar formosana]|uniref:EamA domain-containing protein n=1 Tax=Liquidambar formosana TaxID=63359 RepID=A0AAP0RJ14_LIQFO
MTHLLHSLLTSTPPDPPSSSPPLTTHPEENGTVLSLSHLIPLHLLLLLLPSSSSSSSPSSHKTTFTLTPTNKSVKIATTHVEKIASFYHHAESTKFEKRNRMRSTPIVRKRPFWRRILFASRKMRSIILLNVITIIYASNIPVVKEVEAVMDPAAFSAVRFAVSAIPFLPFVFWARDDVQTRNAGIELGLWVSLGYLSEALGLLTSDAGRASFISLFTVIVVPLLDGMLGAIVPTRTWFGILMSVLGVAMLEFSGSPPNVCIVALLSTIWYVIGGWLDGVPDCELTSWTWAVLWDWIIAFPWIAALYTGVFSTGLCLWVEMAAMRDVSATETAIIYGLEPLWGAGFAWFLLGERWGTCGWIGAALVLGGSLTVQVFGSSSPSKSLEAEEHIQKGDLRLVSDNRKLQTGLSTSPIVVNS